MTSVEGPLPAHACLSAACSPLPSRERVNYIRDKVREERGKENRVGAFVKQISVLLNGTVGGRVGLHHITDSVPRRARTAQSISINSSVFPYITHITQITQQIRMNG